MVGTKTLHNGTLLPHSRTELIGTRPKEMKIVCLNKIAVDFDTDKEFPSTRQETCAH